MSSSSDSDIENEEPSRLVPRLPKVATDHFKKWVRENIAHPYPSKEQKEMFAKTYKLTYNQVADWFVNARRRFVPKVLRELGLPKITPDKASRKAMKRQSASDISMQTHEVQPGEPPLKKMKGNELTSNEWNPFYNLILLANVCVAVRDCSNFSHLCSSESAYTSFINHILSTLKF